MTENKSAELRNSHSPESIRERLKQPGKSSDISDAVLGGIDGCITTFAIVAGALGAGLHSSIALILGFANLLADGFSMAASNYEATKAQDDYLKRVIEKEKQEIAEFPAGEREEIRQIYRQKGFSNDLLEDIVETISADRQVWIETMLTEEYGIKKTKAGPFRSALITMLAFLIVGTFPLLPFLFTMLSMQQQFMLSIALAGFVFFSIGTLKSLMFEMPVLLSGIKTLITGAIAAGLAFLTGHLLRQIFGVTLI